MHEAHFWTSWLFVPGHDRRKIEKAAVSESPVVILDWEDAALPGQKALARQCSREIEGLSRAGKQILIRINSSHVEWRGDDLKEVAFIRPHGVVLPKCESANEVRDARASLREMAKDWEFGLYPMIESPLALLRAEAIATANEHVRGLLFGAFDFCSKTGIDTSPGEPEVLMARSHIVAVAKALGLAAVDSPELALDDLAAVREAAIRSRRLGFTGKLAIHPRHIREIAQAFAPTPEELKGAQEILQQAAIEKGGAFAWKGQMIDEAIVERARVLLRRAEHPPKSPLPLPKRS